MVKGTTDQYLGITAIQFNACQYFYDITAINLDWLEAIGYSMDMSKLYPVRVVTEGFEELNDNIFFGEGNFTFEEMNDMLRKFTENDPDGNGIDDTYGMMYILPNSSTTMTQEGLFGFAYDVNYLYKDKVTGDTVPHAIRPQGYLQWVSRTAEGYMKLPGDKLELGIPTDLPNKQDGILHVTETDILRPTMGIGSCPYEHLVKYGPGCKGLLWSYVQRAEGVATDALRNRSFRRGYIAVICRVQVSVKIKSVLTLLHTLFRKRIYSFTLHLRYRRHSLEMGRNRTRG